MTTRVVLVRPWTDAHSGGGCCTGEVRDGVCLDGRVDGPAPSHAAALVAEAYTALRRECPDVDVQVVGAANTAYLLPTTFRAVRRRHGLMAALRASARSTTAGSVLVDGVRVGDLSDLGVPGVLRAASGTEAPVT